VELKIFCHAHIYAVLNKHSPNFIFLTFVLGALGKEGVSIDKLVENQINKAELTKQMKRFAELETEWNTLKAEIAEQIEQLEAERKELGRSKRDKTSNDKICGVVLYYIGNIQFISI